MKRKLNFGVLALGLFMALTFKVNAASTPTYDEELNKFFANGTPIEINQRTDGIEGAVITWDGNEQKVNKDVSIFGGSHYSDEFIESTNIVMNGGTVKNIFGGGLHKSHVGTSNIIINNGTLSGVTGGGAASLDKTCHGEYYSGDPLKSPTIVDNTNVTILDGDIFLAYGGGEGISNTGASNIVVKGGEIDYLTAGGSNGYTGNANLIIEGGTITVAQTLNRGSINNATLKITNGTINSLYAGGESPESTPDDIVNGGFKENIVVDITGGNIAKFLPGSDFDQDITPNRSNVVVFYKSANIGNAADIISLFGTSAKEYITENNVDFVYNEVINDVELNDSLFSALKDTGNVYTVVVDKGETAYSWVFDGSSITNKDISVNTEITFTNEAPEAIKTEIESQIKGLENVSYLNFSHNGLLPGKATIVYYVGDKYSDGTKLYVSHFNEETKKLEKTQEVTVEDGNIVFDITECSSYVLATNNIVNTENETISSNPKTGDNIILYIVLGIIGVAGTSTIIYNNNKKVLN